MPSEKPLLALTIPPDVIGVVKEKSELSAIISKATSKSVSRLGSVRLIGI